MLSYVNPEAASGIKLLDTRIRLQSEVLQTTRELRASLAELLFAEHFLPPDDFAGT